MTRGNHNFNHQKVEEFVVDTSGSPEGLDVNDVS